MSKPRYVIVRVELGLYQKCLANYENIDSNLVCEGRNRIPDKIPNCRQCYYGDTKEQLVRKVAQILFKNSPKETYQPRYIEQKRKILEVATKIVEFMGVSE